MDVILTELLGNYAFPIVACFVMAWFVYYQDKNHSKEVDMLRQTVDNNTLIITELKDSIDFLLKKEG